MHLCTVEVVLSARCTVEVVYRPVSQKFLKEETSSAFSNCLKLLLEGNKSSLITPPLIIWLERHFIGHCSFIVYWEFTKTETKEDIRDY